MSELTMELLAGMYKNAVVRIAELEREKRQITLSLQKAERKCEKLKALLVASRDRMLG